jgi:hypothetical protein
MMITLTDTEPGARHVKAVEVEQLQTWLALGWFETRRDSTHVLIEWQGEGRPPVPPKPEKKRPARGPVEHWTDRERDE